MREFTIEEKAKAYDEALKVANKYKDTHIMFPSIKDEMFPELKESEDEKIRKEIISAVNIYCSEYIRGEKVREDMLAWLEKQDSHYTFEIKKGHWYKCVCDYMLNGSDLMFKNGRLYYCRRDWRLGGEIDERNVKDIGVFGYKSFFRPATNQEIKDWLEKQGEQRSKLVDFDLNANDSDLQEVTYFIPDGFHAEIIGDKVVIKQGEQKPAEWSEEDKDMLGILLKMINFASDHYQHDDKATDIKAWVLKSLKDRVQLKQEWSEEDEKKLSTTISYLLDVEDFPLNAEKCINWLKELKNRVLSQWKPSNEQLKGIECAIKTLQHQLNVGDKRLNSLYEDLKKLREE